MTRRRLIREKRGGGTNKVFSGTLVEKTSANRQTSSLNPSILAVIFLFSFFSNESCPASTSDLVGSIICLNSPEAWALVASEKATCLSIRPGRIRAGSSRAVETR